MQDRNVSRDLPASLLWLADAPLFIDEELVYRFYDAVVRPETEEGPTTLQITEANATKIGAKLGAEASLSPSDLLQSLATLLPFLKFTVKGSGEAAGEHNRSDQTARTINLHPIKTPQRQLVQLMLHYLINIPDRLCLVGKPAASEWRTPEYIDEVPRALVFLNLPGQEEARQTGQAETKIIPVAAEFSNGKIETLFQKLMSKDGREAPPDYPEPKEGKTIEVLREERKKYWSWFDFHFNATRAMSLVEEAAAANGRIRWIAYRLPISRDGDTPHLTIAPSEHYDTGVFAYQIIKRGYKHGLRLVGTLKSEPDMNMLAIYDK